MMQAMDLPITQPYLMTNTDDYDSIDPMCGAIASYYRFTVRPNEAPIINAVPDGAIDLVFGVGCHDIHSVMGGTVLGVKPWTFDPGYTYYGVRFRPGEWELPSDLTIADLLDTDITLDSRSFGSAFIDGLASCTSLTDWIKLYSDGQSPTPPAGFTTSTQSIEAYIRKRIYATCGTISITQLADESGYSESYIRRIFKQVHGISPKVFETIIRYQLLLHAIQTDTNQTGFDALSADCGYYDQSHMMKDFKRFTGTTPEAYRTAMVF